MRLHIISYNMQGICSQEKAARVRSMIQEFRPKLDVFCGQEHKMRAGPLKLLPLKVWKEATFIVAPALDGAWADRDSEAILGKGGVFIAVGPSLKSGIVASGVLPSGRGVWVTFDHPKLGWFGILNVYAPTGTGASAERKRLWKEIFHNLPNTIPWIFVGDLNMIEKLEDQKGGNPHCISGREKRAWDHLLRKYNWRDKFRREPNQLQYTWDNRRRGSEEQESQRILMEWIDVMHRRNQW
jgi:hypothetical protein